MDTSNITITCTDEAAGIPLVRKQIPALEGANSLNLAAAARSSHPVDDLQRRRSGATANTRGGGVPSDPFRDLQHVRRMYGSALAMRLATERKIADEQERMALPLGGGGGSTLYREIVTGTDTHFEFEDYLGRPELRPEIGGGAQNNPHSVMERQLGM